ncbi:MAG: hypothetical protein GWN71_06885 [Gammaproteobacteria bacterium]|nr:flippase-like domain-containing protein [Gemmatimonadota bacterium]NIR35557.1 flippase-like domain-containing protein [Actinomycetota bacterium]NIU73306.1 hypothetical protein [Gammaproteobacteria bacterium]NIY07745.1 hypothetical protein [Gemmatimonadota bacterium]
MTARVAIALSILAGAAVMVYVTMQAGANLTSVVGLLPARVHALALAAFAADFLGRAVRVSLLARGVGHPVRFSTSLWAMLAGEGAGAVTPSKAGAAPAKIAILTRDRMDVGTGGAVLVGETLAEAIALVPLAILALLFLPAGRLGAYAALGYAVLVAVAVVVLYWVARLPLRDAPSWWSRLGLGERRWRVLRVVARRFRHRSKALEHLSLTTLAGIGVATVVHIAGRLAVLPALAVGRVHGDAIASLIGWPFLLLYGGAMVPTPAAGGAIEAGFAAALASVLPRADLGGLLLWWRVYTFYAPALLGGAILILGGVIWETHKATRGPPEVVE